MKEVITESPVFSQLCVASCLCVPSQAYIFCSVALLWTVIYNSLYKHIYGRFPELSWFCLQWMSSLLMSPEVSQRIALQMKKLSPVQLLSSQLKLQVFWCSYCYLSLSLVTVWRPLVHFLRRTTAFLSYVSKK